MEPQKDQVVTLLMADQIIEPLEAMRTEFDRDKLYELAESIKQYGLINPITVRPNSGKYEIVAGQRRFRACGIASVVKIPCVIREMSDDELLSMRAHENLFRDDIDPIDEAIYVGKLVGDDETKIPTVAKSLNRSVQWVEDRLNILTYPDNFVPPLKAGKIKLGVAKALAQIEDEMYRNLFLDQAVRDGMNVWQADYYLAQWQNNVYQDSSEIQPPSEGERQGVVAKIRQRCEKCGDMAEAPNLQNVFIHVECPETKAAP